MWLTVTQGVKTKQKEERVSIWLVGVQVTCGSDIGCTGMATLADAVRYTCYPILQQHPSHAFDAGKPRRLEDLTVKKITRCCLQHATFLSRLHQGLQLLWVS